MISASSVNPWGVIIAALPAWMDREFLPRTEPYRQTKLHAKCLSLTIVVLTELRTVRHISHEASIINCWWPDIVVYVHAAGCKQYRWTRYSAGWKTYGTWRRWSACAFCSLNPSAWMKTLQASSSYPGQVLSGSTSLVITCRRCWRERLWSARSWGRCSSV